MHSEKKLTPHSEENSLPDLITPIDVMFFDTDVGGGIHNLAYLRFIETARTLLAVKRGMDWKKFKAMNRAPVVAHIEIDYLRSATFGEPIEVHSWIGEVTRARFRCHFKILRSSDKTLLVTCKQMLAFVDMTSGKPQRLPEGFPASSSP